MTFICKTLAKDSFIALIVVLAACVLISFVRKLWKLAFNYVTGNILSLLLIAATTYALLSDKDETVTQHHIIRNHSAVKWIWKFMQIVGSTFASFEGIALVLGIMQHSKDREKFKKLYTWAILL